MIILDLREIVFTRNGWIKLAQDMVYLLIFMEKIMNHGIYKSWQFVDKLSIFVTF
jgi:hypothetical protein